MSAARKLHRELTLADVATLLGVTPEQALRLATRRGLPCLADSMRFDHGQVMAWFSALPRTARPESTPKGDIWRLAPDITPLDPPETGGVYAIGAATGHVKIGRAWNFKRRLAVLQCANPSPLVLLAVLSDAEDDEREFHHMFSEHCVGGEWFAPHPDVIMAIRDARRIW